MRNEPSPQTVNGGALAIPSIRSETRDGLFYERGAAVHALRAVTGVAELPDGVALTVDTDDGSPATVTLRFLTRRTLEVALDPPAPDTVVEVGDRFRSPNDEDEAAG